MNSLPAAWYRIVLYRTWDTSPGVQVIIDGMMNLELMMYASKLPGGKSIW